jgi:predicted dehydrogenase
MLFEVREAGVRHMVWFNYRRAPALTLLRDLVAGGELGEIHHFRATYLQDWLLDPSFPLVWRLDRTQSGSGAHGDLNAHLIDSARWIAGEIDEVVGLSETFVKSRPAVAESAGLSGRGKQGRAAARSEVTVDDTTLFLARFRSGAIGSFECTRFAAGRKNYNRIEVNGSKGSAVFNLERMNELEIYKTSDPASERGFRTVLVTESIHPYIQAYWPPGHTIGYEHTFVNQAADLVKGIAGQSELRPGFEDGLRCQEVLEAVTRSCEERRWERVGLVPSETASVAPPPPSPARRAAAASGSGPRRRK